MNYAEKFKEIMEKNGYKSYQDNVYKWNMGYYSLEVLERGSFLNFRMEFYSGKVRRYVRESDLSFFQIESIADVDAAFSGYLKYLKDEAEKIADSNSTIDSFRKCMQGSFEKTRLENLEKEAIV